MPSVRERAPGVWTVRVPGGTDPVDGRRITHTATFRGSKRAAETFAHEYERKLKRGTVNGGSTTVADTITAWRAKARHSTSYSRNLDLAVKTVPEHLKRTPISKVRAATVEALDDWVLAEHGPERARLVHALISGALTYAWRQEWIPENVARKVTPPAPRKRKDSTPTSAELQKLLELVVERPELHAWLLLSAMLGGRPSEVLALRWSDIDLDRQQVTISKALEPIGSSGRIKTTKTDTERTVAIGALTTGVLRVWREAFEQRCNSNNVKAVSDPYVFVRPECLDGSQPWRPDLGSKRFRKLRDKAGVNGRVRRYDLRHMVATLLLDQGIPLKTVSDRLGHTRIETTANIYGHKVGATDQALAELLEASLG